MVPFLWLGTVAASPALIMSLTVKVFPNKQAPYAPNNIPTNPPICSFASYLVFSVMSFN